MAGTNLQRLMAPQAQQPQPMASVAQPQAVVTPEILAQIMAPYAMQNTGAGVSQFLTGQMGIPMQFGVDMPVYDTPQFTPGDFANFMRARNQSFGDRSAAIPVFNPNTGTYTAFESKAPKSS
jgi:hypothetical protein